MPDTQEVANEINRMAAEARSWAARIARQPLSEPWDVEELAELLRRLAGVAEASATYMARRGGLQL